MRVPYLADAYNISLLHYPRYRKHKNLFLWETLDYYLSFTKSLKILLKRIKFSTLFRIVGIEFLANRFPHIYEHNFIWTFPAYEMEIVIEKS